MLPVNMRNNYEVEPLYLAYKPRIIIAQNAPHSNYVKYNYFK